MHVVAYTVNHRTANKLPRALLHHHLCRSKYNTALPSCERIQVKRRRKVLVVLLVLILGRSLRRVVGVRKEEVPTVKEAVVIVGRRKQVKGGKVVLMWGGVY